MWPAVQSDVVRPRLGAPARLPTGPLPNPLTRPLSGPLPNPPVRPLTGPLTTSVLPSPLASVLVALLAGVLVASLAPPTSAQARRGVYGWPLAPPHPVLRAFSAPTTPYGPGHRGVDLGGSAGEPVLAAGDGTVLFAGEVGDRPVVSVVHGGGLRTTYEPVSPTVRTGDPIRRGEPLGTLLPGHEGCPIPACLHWGARRGQVYLNPIRLVSPGRIRLLPLPPAATPGRAPPRQVRHVQLNRGHDHEG
ncbi:M23 family metallopeptidase [Umezawaea endophytica]|uniref:Peptidoglycan DD-metalloendopeptidase family protein n=2 Tax=Umezawaea endophytica TaxID=1654476 RepID=A0A9X2VTN5_9PSEU|nr:peptidoglycan DD-metalloendopeptidase family protein [Umezawaea endophytica]